MHNDYDAEDTSVEEEAVEEVVFTPVDDLVEAVVAPKGVHPLYTIVVVEEGEQTAYLLDKTEHPLPPGRREVSNALLQRAPKARKFVDEIVAAFPSAEEVELALYRRGVIDTDSVDGDKLAKAVSRIILRMAADLTNLLTENVEGE
jgi:hypothetical protein